VLRNLRAFRTGFEAPIASCVRAERLKMVRDAGRNITKVTNENWMKVWTSGRVGFVVQSSPELFNR
jgi:hypothetical protein